MLNMEESENLPSIREQGKNLVKTSVEIVKGFVTTNENVFASDKQIGERIDHCKKCEYYIKKENRCRLCGCFLQYKTKFLNAHCPIKKW